ncbi:MAG: hypothetical protein RLZ57_413 [Actinomycetota bacterium]|jgi:pimeloyl-ACP methyl ester carboxylesterase
MKRSYIDLRGQKIWHSSKFGFGQPVLLLHGGLSRTESFDKYVLPALRGRKVFAYDRTGHGRSPDANGSFHFEFQTTEAIAYIEDVIKAPAHLIGYSDGGIIALMVAIKRPDLVHSLVLIGANYHYDMSDFKIPNTPPTEEDRDNYAKISPDPAHTLDEKIKKMHKIWKVEPNLTLRQLRKIDCPTLVVAGDDDVVRHEHTIEIYENIPKAQLNIIQGASHALVKEKPKELQRSIKDFYNNPAPTTIWSLRRARRVTS